MADEFIQIPSYLTENAETIIQPMATGCTDWCEVYDECCNYENCMGSCTTCQDGCEISCESACQVGCQTGQNPATGASLTISGVGKTYFTATVSGLDTSMGIGIEIEWYLDGSLYYTTLTRNTSAFINVTGLSSGNSYTMSVKIYNNDNGSLLKTLSKSVTTDSTSKLPTPTLDTSATIKTANSITVTTNSVSGATNYYFRINGGTTIDNGTVRTKMFTGLISNTQYYIEIKVGGTGYSDSDWAGYYATTLVSENWQWTTIERTALTNNGLTTVITYLRWNEFIDKVYEVFASDWRTSSSDGAVLSYSATKMNSTDKVLTADRFNSVRYNIGSRISTGITRVYTNDDVLGSYFITLETKLNEWIAST